MGRKRITVCHNYANVKCVTRSQNKKGERCEDRRKRRRKNAIKKPPLRMSQICALNGGARVTIISTPATELIVLIDRFMIWCLAFKVGLRPLC